MRPYVSMDTASAFGSGLTAGKMKVMSNQDTTKPNPIEITHTTILLNASEDIFQLSLCEFLVYQ